jgi:O-antigen ligase
MTGASLPIVLPRERRLAERDEARTMAPNSGALSFAVVVLYIVLEYGRPQQVFPALAALHLPGLVTAALVLLLVWSKRTYVAHTETKLFIALLTLMIAHVPVALNNYWAFFTAESMVVTFVAYLAIITFVDSVERFKTFIAVWLAVNAFNAVYALFHAPAVIGAHGVGETGVGSFLGEENDFALAVNIALPFAFFMLISAASGMSRFIHLVLVALFVSTNVLTFSRAGFVGLVAVTFYCWLRSRSKLFSLLVIGALTLLVVAVAPQGYWDEIGSIEQGTDDATGGERLYLWGGGFEMFLAHPIAGVGQGNFSNEFKDYEQTTGANLNGKLRAGLVAHSVYVTLLAELGLVGTCIWLAMVACYVRNTRSVRRALSPIAFARWRLPEEPVSADGDIRRRQLFNLSLAAEGSLVAYLVGGVFNTVLYYPSFWLLSAVVIVLDTIASSSDADSARD